MRIMKNATIKSKILFPIWMNIPFVIFLATLPLFAPALIKRTASESSGQSILFNELRQNSMNIQSFYKGNLPFSVLEKNYKAMEKELRQQALSNKSSYMATLDKEWDNILSTTNKLNRNVEIENKVVELTELSLKQSTGYINSVSVKLADPKLRSEVTVLERMVIIGATVNNEANFRIQSLF